MNKIPLLEISTLPGQHLVERAEHLVVTLSLKFHQQMKLKIGQPYRINDIRWILVLSGSAEYTIDLEKFKLNSGDILLIPSFSIIELTKCSDDFELEGVSISTIQPYTLLHIPNSPRREEFDMIIKLLYTSLKYKSEKYEYANALAKALLELTSELASEKNIISHDIRLFQQFRRMVIMNCKKHRNLSWYASELGVSRHHLSICIKKVSGKSPSEWVEEAVIQEAKTMLFCMDLTVLEISYALGFPNNAFFTKYFKRITGMTPCAYRKKMILK